MHLGFTEQHARTCGHAAAIAAICAHADKLARAEYHNEQMTRLARRMNGGRA